MHGSHPERHLFLHAHMRLKADDQPAIPDLPVKKERKQTISMQTTISSSPLPLIIVYTNIVHVLKL